MNSISKFNANIAKIESLKISFYEKDIIRSAYYNHLNNIPLTQGANNLLKRHSIRFYNGNIIISIQQNKIEERKKRYKRSDFTKDSYKQVENQKNNVVYSRDYAAQKIAPTNPKHSQILASILHDSHTLYAESMELLHRCESLLNKCFTQHELSYSMIQNIIVKANEGLQNSINALNTFLNPFLEFFDGLDSNTQGEILQRTQVFLAKIQTYKNLNAKLCLELSSIQAGRVLKKEKDFTQYLQATIKELNAYTNDP
ncbi:hypothetical protein CQA53_03085 [Helicobacter didelphidarum]|uniref:Uncharacterized protein n=1 Tax=Helicobacter didelphidarum TaxID=2040648 RepID=A0A3D8INE1_9HELI|nr:hypothetical protein [Helicobacter didelphidarum]RDU66769.1 hypothetical protein CQA53_03085 [Helicobacter didelphidarum]